MTPYLTIPGSVQTRFLIHYALVCLDTTEMNTTLGRIVWKTEIFRCCKSGNFLGAPVRKSQIRKSAYFYKILVLQNSVSKQS